MRCKTDPPVGADCGCSRRGGGSGGVGNWRGGGGAEDVRRDVDDVLVLHILDIFRAWDRAWALSKVGEVQTVLSKLGSDRSRGETRRHLHPHLTSTLGTSIPRRVRVHAVHFHVAGTRRASTGSSRAN